MPAPRPTSNHDGLNKAFARMADYLDGLEQQVMARSAVQVSGGKGTRVTEGLKGQFIVEVDAATLTAPLVWQLSVNKDRLYINPGFVHVPDTAAAALAYTAVLPRIGNRELMADSRPYWGLPLTGEQEYSIWLAIDTSNASPAAASNTGDATAAIVNITEIPTVPTCLDSLTQAIKVHSFVTNVDGYPIQTPQTQTLRSEPIIQAAQKDWTWFGVEDTSEGEVFSVTINEGRITAPDLAGINSADPTPTAFLREITVEGNDFEVVDGSKIYLKITAEPVDIENEYTNEEQVDDPEGGPSASGSTYKVPDLITVSTWVKGRVWGAVSGELIMSTTEPENTDTIGHVLLTEIEITDGKMTIKRRRTGGVDVTTIAAAFGDDVEVDANIEDHQVCVDGEAHDASFLAKTNTD
jgi:hypothetical protein